MFFILNCFFLVARRVFGYSTLLASFLTLLTPAAAAAGFGWAVALRVVLGFLLGATWPAILPMASKWIPPMDRSKFMSNMMGKWEYVNWVFVIFYYYVTRTCEVIEVFYLRWSQWRLLRCKCSIRLVYRNMFGLDQTSINNPSSSLVWWWCFGSNL